MLSVHRITMSPAFRISLQSNVTDNNCRLAVDFTYQKKLIQRLDFLAGAVCLLLLLPLIFVASDLSSGFTVLVTIFSSKTTHF